ncbi:hypothetical protein [Actinomadura sp. SCN-SB]|uniref:hypothetical protein n=1 Tax=Actinomadura sp. SCN-SB TaxID=3373092 RepID=UPI00374FDBD9
MASHPLIEEHLAQLARQLPAEVVDELADGLTETYRHHLTTGTDPNAAARHALAEFGTPDQITTAFVAHSPSRHAARTLLATGPPVAAAWATALITGHAWQWPIPTAAGLTIGLVLLAVVATLATAATGRARYTRTRIAVLVGGIGLIVLDAAALTGLALITPALAWPLAIAACASLIRIGLALRTLPRILSI